MEYYGQFFNTIEMVYVKKKKKKKLNKGRTIEKKKKKFWCGELMSKQLCSNDIMFFWRSIPANQQFPRTSKSELLAHAGPTACLDSTLILP